jgi:hypothetical protein
MTMKQIKNTTTTVFFAGVEKLMGLPFKFTRNRLGALPSIIHAPILTGT